MTEWTEKYNPFNSMKGLLYKQHYDAILKGNFLPPIEASVDPSNSCNLNCIWCNSVGVIDRGATVLMSSYHLFELCRFFADWGVEAVCFAGGGEPLMHPDIHIAMGLCKELGMETSIITNGTLFEAHHHPLAILTAARWIGISVDAAFKNTYLQAKGRDELSTVFYNIANLVSLKHEYNLDTEITYKFLIHPLNQDEIRVAAIRAKELGCDVFHVRPVAQLYQYGKENPFNIAYIERQLNHALELEDENFRVIGVRHKFDADMHRYFPFKKCRVTPLMAMFEANGDVNLCIDRKGDPGLRLCSHNDVEEVQLMWGSDHHKGLIDSINLDDCPKCTFNIYNEIIEKAVIEDRMCWKFT